MKTQTTRRMSFIEKYRLLQRVHNKIRLSATGTPDEFAKAIGKSKRCTYNILDELKDLGAEIKYSRTKQSFEYLNDFDIDLKIEGKNIKGGRALFNIFFNNAEKLHSNNLLLQTNN